MAKCHSHKVNMLQMPTITVVFVVNIYIYKTLKPAFEQATITVKDFLLRLNCNLNSEKLRLVHVFITYLHIFRINVVKFYGHQECKCYQIKNK